LVLGATSCLEEISRNSNHDEQPAAKRVFASHRLVEAPDPMGRRFFNSLGGYSSCLVQKPAVEDRQAHPDQLQGTHHFNLQVTQVKNEQPFSAAD
jgi:hypothetical protein